MTAIPEKFYLKIKAAEPLDCWEAYDEVWAAVEEELKEERTKLRREIEGMIEELESEREEFTKIEEEGQALVIIAVLAHIKKVLNLLKP